MEKRNRWILLAFLGISTFGFAQIKEEKLILNKKREPEVKKIEKKKTSVATVKNYPPKEKRIHDSLNLTYQIEDVPAVSGFKTTNIQGEDLSPKFENSYQDNYFRLGYGNYGKILADANISTTLENKMEFGADAHVLTTNGLKKDYEWDSDAKHFNVGAFLNNYGEKGKFNLNADFTLDDYNYYGIYALPVSENADLTQRTNRFNVNGYYDFYSNEILNDVRVKSSFLKDHFDASENQVSLLANLSKHAVELGSGDVVMNADLGLGLETVQTDFSLLNQNSATFLNAGITPKITFAKGDSYLMIGSSFNFLNSKNNSNILTEELKENKAYWFPRAESQLATGAEFKFYGGVDGGLTLNTYSEMLRENPFLVSDQTLKPTETKYKIYAGLRGDFNETIKYDFSAGFGKIKNIMFYSANPTFGDWSLNERSAYDFANTFSAVYDDGNLSEVKASIQYFPLENLSVDAGLHFTKYDLENYEHIYNRPLFTLNFGANYTMFEKKLQIGFKGYAVTDRTTNNFTAVTTDTVLGMVENTNEKVGGYVDLNLSAEYKIHKNFSIFALGNNLLNANYRTFQGYKVLGAQVLGGVKITF